jgi:hypothetical protein
MGARLNMPRSSPGVLTMTTRSDTVRLTRAYRQTLHAAPRHVFPLLCPEREKQWLPGWDARMIYSESGVAEPRAVFATHDGDGNAVVWLFAAHKPSRHLHLIRWHPEGMLVDIELDLSSPQADMTCLDVRYTYTATSEAGRQRIAAMTPEQWQAQMTHWETHLDAWLLAHPQ